MANEAKTNGTHSSGKSISYFAPGPAKLPHAVLPAIADDVLEYGDTQVSILELSHRSKDFEAVLKETDRLVRDLLKVPDNYRILFVQGGGNGQFAAIPLNLMKKSGGMADYFVTGTWSKKAQKEACKYGKANLVLATSDSGVQSLPASEEWNMSPEADYVYYCDNETIEGFEWPCVPELKYPSVPLVCDMSSNFFSRPVDVKKYGVIFGGAQKNIGCAGVTVVIIRDDLVRNTDRGSDLCPSVLSYDIMEKNNSLFNTPPTFAIQVLKRVLGWIKSEGGVEKMCELAERKSKMVYDVVRASNNFYRCPLNSVVLSRMNVVFNLTNSSGEIDSQLESNFVQEAAKEGLLSLKGHRSVGGIRASLYNAIEVSDVEHLCAFMRQFMKLNMKW